MRPAPVLLALLLALPLSAQEGGRVPPPAAREAVRVPAGRHLPLYAHGGAEVEVAAFELDRRPVTRAEFREFVRAEPRWRRGAVPSVLADAGYLADWRSDLDVGSAEDARRPVTGVSWFAARAFCEREGKRLPTADEWEYAARADEDRRDASGDPAFAARLLRIYGARTSPPAPVGSGFRNAYGVEDLHGPAWEWVLDFNNVLVSDDSRGTGRDSRLYCAAGTVGATTTSDYASFLRHAFRAGLRGSTTVGSLGFRCARSL